MKQVIAHLERISQNLDDALRAMQGPAVWNDLANRAERNADEYRDDNGACKGNLFWNDSKCQNCSESWTSHVCTRCGVNPRRTSGWCEMCWK